MEAEGRQPRQLVRHPQDDPRQGTGQDGQNPRRPGPQGHEGYRHKAQDQQHPHQGHHRQVGDEGRAVDHLEVIEHGRQGSQGGADSQYQGLDDFSGLAQFGLLLPLMAQGPVEQNDAQHRAEAQLKARRKKLGRG